MRWARKPPPFVLPPLPLLDWDSGEGVMVPCVEGGCSAAVEGWEDGVPGRETGRKGMSDFRSWAFEARRGKDHSQMEYTMVAVKGRSKTTRLRGLAPIYVGVTVSRPPRS